MVPLSSQTQAIISRMADRRHQLISSTCRVRNIQETYSTAGKGLDRWHEGNGTRRNVVVRESLIGEAVGENDLA